MTCYTKQKRSETQRFCGFSDTKGIKLGFTTYLSIDIDDLLDSMCLWNPTSAFSVPFYPTYGTRIDVYGENCYKPNLPVLELEIGIT